MIEIVNVMLHEPSIPCPKEIVYTRNALPSFHTPIMDIKNASIEQVDVKLPVLMKDGNISEVTLTDWRIQCHFEGMDWYGNAHTTNGGNNSIPDSHVEIWCNENNNNGQYVYAKPSFPIEAVCVDRNYNRDGLYLFLREYEEKPEKTNQEKWDAVKHFFMELCDEQDIVIIPGIEIYPRFEKGKSMVSYSCCDTPDNLQIESSQENGLFCCYMAATWGNTRVERLYSSAEMGYSHLDEYSY